MTDGQEADGVPLIDVVIPVHDPSRPIQRTIESLLKSGLKIPEELRINVVCHNIDVESIASVISDSTRPLVRFLALSDGEPSPAGPFFFGIQSATAEYVSIMGSDDTLEPGALRAWLEMAQRLRLTALIPPERHANGGKVATPPVRPWRRGLLDPLRDRVVYRTAPLGLIRRTAISDLGLEMPSHLRNGSDQLFGLKLWFSGERLGYGKGLPSYVVGADAATRVTFTVRPAEDELRAVREIVTDPWFQKRPISVRRAIVTKSLRVHVFSAALLRSGGDRWTSADREYISQLLELFSDVAPGYLHSLSIADRRLVDALAAGEYSSEQIEHLLRQRRPYIHPRAVITRDLRGLLAIDSPIRFMVAARLL